MTMPDRKKVIKGLEWILEEDRFGFGINWETGEPRDEYEKAGKIITDTIALLKEQEVRELTIDEWREWKANPKQNPICKLWKNDVSPMWVLDPNNVQELMLLMGELKLFTGKPTFEQCKEVKWKTRMDY